MMTGGLCTRPTRPLRATLPLAVVCIMDTENENEMAQACHLLRQNGFERAAFIVGREWANELKAKRKPRKKGVWVKLLGGGKAFLDKERVDEATERED